MFEIELVLNWGVKQIPGMHFGYLYDTLVYPFFFFFA